MKRYIWGFPGVGKSTLDIPWLNVVDADCARFQFRDVEGSLHGSGGLKHNGRDPDYPQNYLEFVRTVDADAVLLNCHVGLLEQLDKENVLIIYPDVSLMPEYLERYRARGDSESFVSYMEDEAKGIISFIEASGFERYRVGAAGVYLQDLFEREDFKMKLMTRMELTEQLQRAIDLGVMIATYQAGDNARLVCHSRYADMEMDAIRMLVHHSSERVENAAGLTEAVLDGKYQLDIDELISVCIEKEEAIKRENMLLERRGGLSREELADKIMQGIVNGALGIEYDQIAPYSHGYEVTFGGDGPIGSTRDFKNRWECYHCDFFGVPEKIVSMIEREQQDGRVFGKDVKLLNIREMLQTIDEMEAKKITSFKPEKDTNFERWGARGYGSRGSIATVMDVHAGKGLDGIVQHHYHGDYSSMTPSSQNSLVETLVFMKGFCLDYLDKIDGGAAARDKVIDYLKKHGIDISTPEKMRAWILENPEKCGREANRVVKQLTPEKYAQAYCDFIELKALVEAHKGSVDDFIDNQGLFGDWNENSFKTSFGALTDVYLYEQEDGSVGLSYWSICVWDHEHDVGEEDLLFSGIKAKCEKLGFDLNALEEKALQKVAVEHDRLDPADSPNSFGLQQETYQSFLNRGFDDEDIKGIVDDWGVEDVEKGYTIFRVSGSDVVVEGALLIEAISEIGRFEGDFEACREAEKDGVKFINDVAGLEKGCYIDTPENRALCVKMIKEHPEYRIENWLDVNSDFGKKYTAQFGPVISLKNWKMPLAQHGIDLYQKWNGMMEEDVRKGTFDGTADYEDRIETAQDAAGWMLATYDDTALEVIGDWVRDFQGDDCWGIPLRDIQAELEKCFGLDRDLSVTKKEAEGLDAAIRDAEEQKESPVKEQGVRDFERE